MMKTIDIKPQPSLSLSRLFSLTLHGIRYRLFRSAVTVVVIAVAVSFLMNVFVQQQVCARAIVRCREEARALRLAAFWAARLQDVGTIDALLAEAASPEGNFATEAKKFCNWSDNTVAEVQADARQAERFLAFLDDLDYGRRRRLIGGVQGAAVFEGLAEKTRQDRFFAVAAEMKSVRLPLPAAELAEFITQHWPLLRQRLAEVQSKRQEAIAGFQQWRGDRSVLEALTGAAGECGEEIRRLGFDLSSAEAAIVAHQAKSLQDVAVVESTLAWDMARKALSARLGISPNAVNADALWEALNSAAGAAWYRKKAGEAPEAAAASAARFRELDAERLQKLAIERGRLRRLAEIERYLVVAGQALAERLTWLLIVSLVLCTVGIANAMLMSVTERFREIATLKCLGALDSSILWMFVFEACLLGAIGGVIGAILGLFLGLGRMLFAFGGFLFVSLPASGLAAGALIAVVAGVILAAIASVYPSLKAARLAPMEAMRIE